MTPKPCSNAQPAAIAEIETCHVCGVKIVDNEYAKLMACECQDGLPKRLPPSHQQKLEAIRRACVEANPKEPEEGDDPRLALIRNIGLADVLLTLHKFHKSRWISVNTGGELQQHDGIDSVVTLAYWHLRNDDLSKQSEETVDFIHRLLEGV